MQRTSLSELVIVFGFIFSFVLISACGEEVPDDLTAYTNVTIWTGTDQPSRDNSALIIRNGKVEEVISMTEWDLPEETPTVDLSGSYIIPGLINAHGHVGIAKGLETGPDIHSRENVIDQLRLYVRYGIAVFLLKKSPAFLQ